jgi:hypothetical protein
MGNLREAHGLVKTALRILEMAIDEDSRDDRETSCESVAWRLADALGSIADEIKTGPGITEFTGLGFRIERKCKNG